MLAYHQKPIRNVLKLKFWIDCLREGHCENVILDMFVALPLDYNTYRKKFINANKVPKCFTLK